MGLQITAFLSIHCGRVSIIWSLHVKKTVGIAMLSSGHPGLR